MNGGWFLFYWRLMLLWVIVMAFDVTLGDGYGIYVTLGDGVAFMLL